MYRHNKSWNCVCTSEVRKKKNCKNCTNTISLKLRLWDLNMYLLSKTQKFIAIVDHNDKKDNYLNNELITGSGTPCPYENSCLPQCFSCHPAISYKHLLSVTVSPCHPMYALVTPCKSTSFPANAPVLPNTVSNCLLKNRF